MFNRRSILSLAALACLPFASSAFAGEMAFSPSDFQNAQAAGKSIVLDISAPWCPTCRAQAPIIQKLSASDKYKDFVVLNVDFDSQQDFIATLNVRQQSTLIAFKGKSEVARSVGDTQPDSINALFEKAL
jgi:thioredoxin 1